MKGFEVLCEHPAVCARGCCVLGEEVRGGFYPDGFAWSGEGWGAAWGVGACCVSAVSGRTRAGMVFGVAHCVLNPTTRITHKNY